MAGDVWAVVPAGGAGTRMGAAIPKQYLELNRRPMIEHVLARLSECAGVSRLVIGVDDLSPGWRSMVTTGLKPLAVAAPGKERADTVASCLRYICAQGGKADWALVHDAARPCVRVSDIETLLAQVEEGADGGILAVPVSDTLKRGLPDGCIDKTVSRRSLWRAMTPQLFRAGELLAAIESARRDGVTVTDEASAMEHAGAKIKLVACAPDNIKVTLPGDVRFAELVLQGQIEEQEETR